MCIQKLTLSCPTSTMSADGDGRRKNYKKACNELSEKQCQRQADLGTAADHTAAGTNTWILQT